MTLDIADERQLNEIAADLKSGVSLYDAAQRAYEPCDDDDDPVDFRPDPTVGLRRRVLELLVFGPASLAALSLRLGVPWQKLQPVLRALQKQGVARVANVRRWARWEIAP